MKKVFVLIFAIVLSVHLYAGSAGYTEIAMWSKPALLVSLIIFFLFYTPGRKAGKFRNIILLGLIFSLGGDVFLMFQNIHNGYFLVGLISFLIGHLFYLWAFTITYLNNHEIPLIKRQGWVMVLVLGYGIMFFREIKEHVGSMIGPIILYTAAITLMLLMAVNRYGRVGSASFWLITLGAALFVASDSLLAWNKFVHNLSNSHFLIMSTYGVAQLLITLGAIKQVEETGRVEVSSSL